MRTKNYLKILTINQNAIVPIYLQLADSIMQAIEEGRIVENDILPSLHDMCVAFDIGKKTVEKAYEILKHRGVVGSVKGKGYFIASCNSRRKAVNQ